MKALRVNLCSFFLATSLLVAIEAANDRNPFEKWLGLVKSKPVYLKRLVRSLPTTAVESRRVLRGYYDRLYKNGDSMNDDICKTCDDVMGAVRAALDVVGEGPINDILLDICKEVLEPQINGDLFCPGLVKHQAGALFDAMKKLDRATPNLRVCETFNLCIDPQQQMERDPFHHQMALLGETLLPVQEVKDDVQTLESSSKYHVDSMQNTFTVVQLADVHINPLYKEGSPTDCRMWVCCYDYYQGNGSAGPYGDYKCNIPRRTIELFMDKVNSLSPRPAFIIYTGDHPPHSMHNETLDSQLDCTRNFMSLLSQKMQGWKIYPQIGNHEMFPTNVYFTGEPNTQLMTRLFGELWKDWAGFGEEQLRTWNIAGFYTVMTPKAKLRILGFNTNFAYALNVYNMLNIDRPEYRQQLDFMRQVLQNATDQGEKVIMVGHHPPGRYDSIYLWGREYSQIVSDFADTVVLQVFGHTHKDQFQVVTSGNNNMPRGVAFVSPSVTSAIGVNPSMRIFTFEEGTYRLVNFEQHYLDLQVANAEGKDPPQIVKSYSAKEEYGLADMSPASWQQLAHRLETDEVLFQKYIRNFRSKTPSGDDCDWECKVGYVCGALSSSFDKYDQCFRMKNATGPPTAMPTVGTKPTDARPTGTIATGCGCKMSFRHMNVIAAAALYLFYSLTK